ATEKVKNVNDQERIQALVDKKKVIITEDNIRSDLHFDDAKGTTCLLNEAIFENLACIGRIGVGFSGVITPLFDNMMVQSLAEMGDILVETHQTLIVDQPSTSKPQKKQKPRRKHRKEAEVSNDESKDDDHVPTPSSDPLPSEMGNIPVETHQTLIVDQPLQELVRDLQEAKAAQAKEIAALKKKVTKLNKWRKSRSVGLMRLKKFASGRRVKPPMENDSLGARKDASKQGRMIEEIDQNAEITLNDETQGRTNDDEMFEVDDLAGEEVVMNTTTGEHEEQIIEDVNTAEPVTTAGKVVTTTTVKDSAAPITNVTEDEINMAQALAALKSIKPKVVVQEQEMSTIIPATATTVTTDVPTLRAKGIVFHEQKQPTVSSSKDKGKAKMIEPKVLIKKKDQMRFDEEYARRLEAEEQEDKCKAKIIEPEVPLKKKDQMRIDKEYARKLQAEEQKATRLSRAQ
nr:hypothetical protein [Tanacetum cinerariifolium]